MTDSKTTALTTATSQPKQRIPTITTRCFGLAYKPKSQSPFSAEEASFYVQQLAAVEEEYKKVQAHVGFEDDDSDEAKHYGNPTYVQHRLHTAIHSLVPTLLLALHPHFFLHLLLSPHCPVLLLLPHSTHLLLLARSPCCCS